MWDWIVRGDGLGDLIGGVFSLMVIVGMLDIIVCDVREKGNPFARSWKRILRFIKTGVLIYKLALVADGEYEYLEDVICQLSEHKSRKSEQRKRDTR
jgi:hypothetical protein